MTKTDISKKVLLKSLILQNFKKKVKIKSVNGKPIVVDNKNKFFCSGSDSKNIIFLGISKNYEIGVDVEFLKIRSASFLKRIANKEEIEQFKKKKFADTIIWSLKESAQKSDDKIYDPKDYQITFLKKQIYIKRGKKTWNSMYTIAKGFVFSVSIRVK